MEIGGEGGARVERNLCAIPVVVAKIIQKPTQYEQKKDKTMADFCCRLLCLFFLCATTPCHLVFLDTLGSVSLQILRSNMR